MDFLTMLRACVNVSALFARDSCPCRCCLRRRRGICVVARWMIVSLMAPPKGRCPAHAALGSLIGCEQVQSQRLFPAADEINGFVSRLNSSMGRIGRISSCMTGLSGKLRPAAGRNEARFRQILRRPQLSVLQQRRHAGKVLSDTITGISSIHAAVGKNSCSACRYASMNAGLRPFLDQRIVGSAGLPAFGALPNAMRRAAESFTSAVFITMTGLCRQAPA